MAHIRGTGAKLTLISNGVKYDLPDTYAFELERPDTPEVAECTKMLPGYSFTLTGRFYPLHLSGWRRMKYKSVALIARLLKVDFLTALLGDWE